MMSAPASEFGKRWLDEMESAFDGSWARHACQLPHQLSLRYPETIHIEPSRSFYKFMWTREDIYTLLEGYDPDFAGVYSMHLWSHLWWERRRKDFSRFHAGLLTEDYVRSVDTTYNLIARQFLPASEQFSLARRMLIKLGFGRY